MLNYMLEQFQKEYKVIQRDLGEFARIDQKGMHFQIRAYEIEGAGNLCIMDMKAMLGLMKMQTVVFTPLYLDAPMYSDDVISVMGTDTLILELYNTLIGDWDESMLEEAKKQGEDLPDHDPGVHWYDGLRLKSSVFKKGKKIHRRLEEFICQYTDVYMSQLKQAAPCQEDEKRQKTAQYVEGLIANGGPAVDQFTKMLGKEKTCQFLRSIMFASEK